MDKKSQLTLFIVIGIVLVFLVAIVVYLQQQVTIAGFEADKLSALTTESQPVKLFVDKCLEEVAIPGVFYMGVQGGYITPPLDSLYTEKSVIPYYYAQSSNKMPSLSALENEISGYVERTIPLCTNGFKKFSMQISEEKIRATTKINEQNVLIKIFYPLTIKNSQGKEEKIENFVIKIPIRLGHIYNVAKQVVDKDVNNPDFIDLAYLSSFDVNVDVLPFDASSTIFAITDRTSKVNNVNYQLFFASNINADTKPELDFIPDFVLKTGVPFEYKVTARDVDGDAEIFSDDSPMFDINPDTGVISFTPSTKGIVDVTITASDGEKKDSKKIKLDIR